MKILLHKSGKKFYSKGGDFHSQYGMIKEEDLINGVVKTNTGVKLYCMDASFIDLFNKIKRGPQIIAKKDTGIIITECGLNKNSKVLDCGAGSGANTLFLANICKKIVSYEIRQDHFDLVQKNIEFLGAKNITLKLHDIYTGIPDKDFDTIILDVPEPWKVLEHAKKSLKMGGFLVAYSPTIIQIADFVNALDEDFFHVKTVEMIQREWEVQGRKVRPKSRLVVGHTGFISFVRFVPKA